MHISRNKAFTADDYRAFIASFVFPVIALAVFLALWSTSAQQVQTSLGQLPGPIAVFQQAGNLVDEHNAERDKEATQGQAGVFHLTGEIQRIESRLEFGGAG